MLMGGWDVTMGAILGWQKQLGEKRMSGDPENGASRFQEGNDEANRMGLSFRRRLAMLLAGLSAVLLASTGAPIAQEMNGAPSIGALVTPNAEQQTGTQGSPNATTTI